MVSHCVKMSSASVNLEKKHMRRLTIWFLVGQFNNLSLLLKIKSSQFTEAVLTLSKGKIASGLDRRAAILTLVKKRVGYALKSANLILKDEQILSFLII